MGTKKIAQSIRLLHKAEVKARIAAIERRKKADQKRKEAKKIRDTLDVVKRLAYKLLASLRASFRGIKHNNCVYTREQFLHRTAWRHALDMSASFGVV